MSCQAGWRLWCVGALLALAQILPAQAAGNVRGAPGAPVTIMVFSGFDCAFCAETRGTLAQLEADYPGKIRLVYKHFPLNRGDAGWLPHEVAEAAGEQGKFWEMHDALFANRNEGIDRAAAESLARGLKLDMKRFRAHLDRHAGVGQIEADLSDAKALKVQATPTFYIEGYKFDGAQSLTVFHTMVDFVLAGATPRPGLRENFAKALRESAQSSKALQSTAPAR